CGANLKLRPELQNEPKAVVRPIGRSSVTVAGKNHPGAARAKDRFTRRSKIDNRVTPGGALLAAPI
ncbi:MAG: hypothetical protein ACRD9L_03165, partial [Bryobacteraceae bacterium]